MEFLIYSICFGVGLVFAIISAFFGHALGGHEAHIDVGHGADIGSGGHAEGGYDNGGMPGISVLSPTIIASFITAVGGLGMLFSRIEATKSGWISVPLSVTGGLLIAAGVLWMFNMIFQQTQSSSESRVSTLVGLTATIITPIPANGVGEIAYVQAGTRYTAPARELQGTAVAGGKTVKIIRIVGTQFYIQLV